MTQVPGIIFDRVNAPHPRVDSEAAPFHLEFDKTADYFDYYDNEIAFYKGVEKLVRKHTFIRSTYPKYLKEVVGLRCCEVFPNIEDNPKGKVAIEMHHGPILTLFDTVVIVTTHFRKNNVSDLTTFKVANEVIEQHRLNNVRVIMLSKSVHQKVHDDGIYINYKQGFGDTIRFLELFRDGVDQDMRMKINDYIAWSMEHDSTDNDILSLAINMRVWGNNDFDDISSINLGGK
jgi:hypothetical protein